VDVRPLVIADAEATELIQPSKGPLDDPAPPAQPTPVLGAAHSDQRLDMPRPQASPNGGCVVAAIAEHTVWPPSRSPAFAVQRANRIRRAARLARRKSDDACSRAWPDR